MTKEKTDPIRDTPFSRQGRRPLTYESATIFTIQNFIHKSPKGLEARADCRLQYDSDCDSFGGVTRQTRPLDREDAPRQKSCKCFDYNQNLVVSPGGRAQLQDRMTD
jgi:hypothetical protein